jgi:hypothetical protein
MFLLYGERQSFTPKVLQLVKSCWLNRSKKSVKYLGLVKRFLIFPKSYTKNVTAITLLIESVV